MVPEQRAAANDAAARVVAESHGRILAALVQYGGDLDRAEDALADALWSALDRWPGDGVPENPAAWILTTGRNRIVDIARRERTFGDKLRLLGVDADRDQRHGPDSTVAPDYRLRLMFLCCHPALNLESRVALTLRTLGGLTTSEIARAFQHPEPTIGQRIARAKTKIRGSGIPYRMPPNELLAERLDGVLAVIYLIFNEGYAATAGESILRPDLCQRAIDLGRMLVALMPASAEAIGLLALMLLHDARRDARIDDGAIVTLEDQDRRRWNHAAIDEGSALLDRALAIPQQPIAAGLPRGGPYQIQAAIAALHAQSPTAGATDWPQIAALYGALRSIADRPIVRLNEAVAIAMASVPAAGLAILDEPGLAASLSANHLYHAARADLLRRSGDIPAAAQAYRAANDRCAVLAERRYLEQRLAQVMAASSPSL